MQRVTGVLGATILICGEATHADVSRNLLETFEAHGTVERVAVFIVTPGPVVRRVGQVLDPHENDQADETFDLMGGDGDPVWLAEAQELAGLCVSIGLVGDELHQRCRKKHVEEVDGVTVLGQVLTRPTNLSERDDDGFAAVAVQRPLPTIC